MIRGFEIPVWGLILFAGCRPTSNNESVHPQVADSSKVAVNTIDINKEIGKTNIVEGVLEGNCILGETGKEFGVTHKGRDPLRIRYNSIPLALAAESDKIAKQLVAHVGNRVRLRGVIRMLNVEGRRGEPGGQQGLTGPIPYHVVYYLTVDSCESLASDSVVPVNR